jgi:hypothetical protein
LDVAIWNARDWLAGLMACEPSELVVRSIDHYGPLETQVRYERQGEVVARVVVSGPIVPMGEAEGRGHWAVSATIGSGMGDVHTIVVPQLDEIVY